MPKITDFDPLRTVKKDDSTTDEEIMRMINESSSDGDSSDSSSSDSSSDSDSSSSSSNSNS